LIEGDVRDAQMLSQVVRDTDVIIHLAGQVAVTTSVKDPRKDFDSNALGTFNLLEAARLSGKKPVVIYASTNKVYGGMDDIWIEEKDTRYEYSKLKNGVPESYPLDFHSPYGCSKGTGDQYTRDYARIYRIPTVVFRQSTIYGPRQFGIEDQGWMAWLMIAAVLGKPIRIYGDGKQVRDMLFVDDLLDAYDAAIQNIDVAAGQVYNIGGGPQNTVSIWREFGPVLGELIGKEIPVTWDDWRPGDQRIYVSNITKAKSDLGWRPKTELSDGINRLFTWITQNKNLFISQ
jgi:CDP-paratose 2-epimerase